MIDPLRHYREVWLTDFEFRAPNGERPEPVCMVAREWRTGNTLRESADRLANTGQPPFSVGPDSLFVAYYASAELGCFRALGWPMPARVLDLFCEFRDLTNGAGTVAGNGLLGALAHFGLPSIDAGEKAGMRELAQRPGPHTEAERAALLAYCETDVVALAKLLPAMLPKIDMPRALFRGRYMAAVAAMEWNGIPIDVANLERLRGNWEGLKGQLVERIDSTYGVYVPTGRAINPQSTLGAELFRAADDWGVDAACPGRRGAGPVAGRANRRGRLPRGPGRGPTRNGADCQSNLRMGGKRQGSFDLARVGREGAGVGRPVPGPGDRPRV